MIISIAGKGSNGAGKQLDGLLVFLLFIFMDTLAIDSSITPLLLPF
jgi:hypothetical protein